MPVTADCRKEPHTDCFPGAAMARAKLAWHYQDGVAEVSEDAIKLAKPVTVPYGPARLSESR
jgi:hypothetical protein